MNNHFAKNGAVSASGVFRAGIPMPGTLLVSMGVLLWYRADALHEIRAYTQSARNWKLVWDLGTFVFENECTVTDVLIEKGNDLLRGGRWKEAKETFRMALRDGESAEAWEGLGNACSWLSDGDGTVHARETAYRLYVKAGNDRAAGRVATWLANEYGEFRGDGAVASGWMDKARRLLEPLDPCAEQAVVLTMCASLKIFLEKDLAGGRMFAEMARRVALQIDNAESLMVANALDGLARVSEGNIPGGMRLLDEATATAVGGDCENLSSIGATCCCLIVACDRVRDYDRAAQWCEYVREFCRRWRIGSLFSVCRTQYSSVLISQGEWSEAEEELTAAVEELTERRPALVGSATIRLAELRRRQGRFDDAKRLFAVMERHPAAQLGMSALSLDQGDPVAAADHAQRYLRRIPEGDRIERVPGLELLVRSTAAAGDRNQAATYLPELKAIVSDIGTEPLLASGRFAEGVCAASAGDLARARVCFEDAIDAFGRSVMPYESVSVRIALAETLRDLGRSDRSRAEAQTALSRARELGAAFLQQRAFALCGGEVQDGTGESSAGESGQLTPREREVLVLVADGKDNDRIADELFLSVRTVERHISNAYKKLGISGKSARAAATAYIIKTRKSV